MTNNKRMCFVSEGIVEFAINSVDSFADIISQPYESTETTTEEDVLKNRFKFDITDIDGNILSMYSVEPMYSILKSKMIAIIAPEGLDVQIGWLYDGTNFTEN